MKKTKIVLPNGTNINFETDEPLSIKKIEEGINLFYFKNKTIVLNMENISYIECEK